MFTVSVTVLLCPVSILLLRLAAFDIPGRLRQQVYPKRRYLFIQRNSVIYQKTIIIVFSAVRTLRLTCYVEICLFVLGYFLFCIASCVPTWYFAKTWNVNKTP
jgi:hypothetical protein